MRIIVGDATPIPFTVMSRDAELGWNVLSLASPPLALLAWWLILHSAIPRSTLAGMWVRLIADIGQFTALLVFHLATAFTAGWPGEIHAYTRYVYAAAMLFVFLLVVRDVWALMVTNRLARNIDD